MVPAGRLEREAPGSLGEEVFVDAGLGRDCEAALRAIVDVAEVVAVTAWFL